MLIVTLRRLHESREGPNNDYEYEVRMNYDIICKGVVTGHDRDEGWPALLVHLSEHRKCPCHQMEPTV